MKTALQLQAQTRLPTPLGPLTLGATARGLAVAWFDHQAHRAEVLDAPELPQHPHLAAAALDFEQYWRQPSHRFRVALDPQGTAFQLAVWQLLRQIESGSLSTYGQIALALGKPTAARAVGAAIGRNPLSIVVPCHRVVGSNGSLTGYAGGLPRKQQLLAIEGAVAAGVGTAVGTAVAAAIAATNSGAIVGETVGAVAGQSPTHGAGTPGSDSLAVTPAQPTHRTAFSQRASVTG